jgi:hypothetical protein
MMSHDVTEHVNEALETAQEDAARAYDRVDALRELRGLLFDFAGRRGVPSFSLAELFEFPESAEEDARLRALALRAFPDPPDQTEETHVTP